MNLPQVMEPPDQAHPEHQVLLVKLDRQELPVLLVNQEPQEQVVLPVLMDHRDLPELMDPLGHRE
jgi:hypothetical protein